MNEKTRKLATDTEATHDEVICRICGSEVSQLYCDGKRLGRTAEYHPNCKTVANAMSVLSSVLVDIEFVNGSQARTVANELFQTYNLVNNAAHALNRSK